MFWRPRGSIFDDLGTNLIDLLKIFVLFLVILSRFDFQLGRFGPSWPRGNVSQVEWAFEAFAGLEFAKKLPRICQEPAKTHDSFFATSSTSACN